MQNYSSHHDNISNVSNVYYMAPAPAPAPAPAVTAPVEGRHDHHKRSQHNHTSHAHSKANNRVHGHRDDEGAATVGKQGKGRESIHTPATPLPEFHVSDLPDVGIGVEHSISKAHRLEKELHHLVTALQPAVGAMLDAEVLEHLNGIHSFLLKSHIARGAEKAENVSLLSNIRLLADRCKRLAVSNVATKNVANKLARRVETLTEEKEEVIKVLKKDRAALADRCLLHQGKEETQHLLVEKLKREDEDKRERIDSLLAQNTEFRDKLRHVRSEHEDEVKEHCEEITKLKAQVAELIMENQALEEIVEETQSHSERHSEAWEIRHSAELERSAKERAQAELDMRFLTHEAAAASKHSQLLLSDKTRMASQLQDLNVENGRLRLELNNLKGALEQKLETLDQHSAALSSSTRIVSDILHQAQDIHDNLKPVKDKAAEFTSLMSDSGEVTVRLNRACEEANAVLESTKLSSVPVSRDASSCLISLKGLCKKLDNALEIVSLQTRKGVERHQHAMANLYRTRTALVAARGRERAAVQQTEQVRATFEKEISIMKLAHDQLTQAHDSLRDEHEMTVARLEMARAKNAELVDKMAAQRVEMTGVQQSSELITRMHAQSSSDLHLKKAELVRTIKDHMALGRKYTDAQTLFGAAQATIKHLEDQLAHTTLKLSQTQDKLRHSKAMTASSEHRRRELLVEARRRNALMEAQMDRLTLEKSIGLDLLAQRSQYCRRLEELRRHRAAWDHENQVILEKVLSGTSAGISALEERIGGLAEEIKQLGNDLHHTRLQAKSFGEGVLGVVRRSGAGLHELAQKIVRVKENAHGPYLDTHDIANEFMAAMRNVDSSLLELYESPSDPNGGTVEAGEQAQGIRWGSDLWRAVGGPSSEVVQSALQAHHDGLDEAEGWVCDVLTEIDLAMEAREARVVELVGNLETTEVKLLHSTQYSEEVRTLLHGLQEPLEMVYTGMHISSDRASRAYEEAKEGLDDSPYPVATGHAGAGEELLQLSKLRAGLGLVIDQADSYRRDMLKALKDIQASTASRVKRELALDKRLQSLDANIEDSADMQLLDVDLDSQSRRDTSAMEARNGSVISFGELMVKMMEAAEKSLETEAAHNLKLGECITREAQKRHDADTAVSEMKEALEEVTEEKKYLLHMRDQLEARLDGQGVHMDFLRRSGRSGSVESKSADMDVSKTNLTIDVDSEELYSPQKARVLSRQLLQDKNELQNEKVLNARLQGQMDKTKKEYDSLQNEAAKMSAEVESLRADVVTLVDKLQKSESHLMTKTEMYESAMKKVEQLSLRAGQGSRRSMTGGLLNKADVQIVAHTNLVKAARKDRTELTGRSRTDGSSTASTAESATNLTQI